MRGSAYQFFPILGRDPAGITAFLLVRLMSFKGKPYKDERRIYGDKKDQIALSLEKEVNPVRSHAGYYTRFSPR